MNEESEKMKERSLEKRIAEIIRGYNNAQELIRFMDSKLTVIWGFCVTVFAFCVPIEIKLCKNINIHVLNIYSLFVIIMAVALVISTGIAFGATINGILGRKEQGVTTPLPHILFPIGNKCDIFQFKQKISRRTEEDEYNEVCDQLYSVGKILEIKINRSHTAIYSLYIQIITAIFIFLFDNLL